MSDGPRISHISRKKKLEGAKSRKQTGHGIRIPLLVHESGKFYPIAVALLI